MKSLSISTNPLDQGYTLPRPRIIMAILTVDQLIQCLNEAGLKQVSTLLKSESKLHKVIEIIIFIFDTNTV